MLTGGANPDETLPMVVAIHGLGDDPRSFAGLVHGLAAKARVILPQGLSAHEPGWSWFSGHARDEDVAALSAGVREAADRIAGAVAELAEDRPTAGKPIVTGFSQGGILTFALAVHHPELVDAAFPVGGWLPPPLWPASKPARTPPIQALHGTADPAVEFAPTEQAVIQLKSLGFPVTLHAYPGVRHAIPPAMRAQLHELLRGAVSQAGTSD